MDVNVTQIIISVITILISIGGSVAAFIYNAGKQSKAIEAQSKSIDELKSSLNTSINRLDYKTDKLGTNILEITKELAYLKGLFDAERLAKK